MYRRIYSLAVMWAILTVALLFLGGCATYQPDSALYYPPTQEQIDKRAAEDKAWEELQPVMFMLLGFRK